MDTLFGVTWPVAGAICLLIALFYIYKKPAPSAGAPPRPPWRHLLLRWGHPAVWLLLAGACFLQANWLLGGPGWAGAVARAGLLLYLLFLGVLLLERRQAS